MTNTDDKPSLAPELPGCSVSKGFVKSNPANNDAYVELWSDHPWYPVISNVHRQIEELLPGYNVAQIKEKFWGLRYYFDAPKDANPMKLARARALVAAAGAWVEGRESYRRSLGLQPTGENTIAAEQLEADRQQLASKTDATG